VDMQAVKATRSPSKLSPDDLDNLMRGLEVQCVALTECLVDQGYCLAMDGSSMPGLHYNIAGFGTMKIPGFDPIELCPHTLVIVPPKAPFKLEPKAGTFPRSHPKIINGSDQYAAGKGELRRVVAGDGEPDIVLICGFFDVQFGSAIHLFGDLTKPIVEYFDEKDGLEHTLRAALAELLAQEVGAGAMTAALVKQVVISLLRRSLHSASLWVERFTMLSDAKIARALAEMVAHPGGRHSLVSLAEVACLSRSAFIARFTETLGQSPMSVLRDLRMRLAAQQLRSSQYTIDKIAYNVGYESRSSFVRAFQKMFGKDPTEYRTSMINLLNRD
jgi:AraC-like DNA-binding protein